MKEKRKIEREFGVPIAGEILEPAQWSRTALKHWPEGTLDWQALFGRRAPIVVDLGCGNGRFLIGSAVWRTDHDHLGVDLLPVVLRYATRRANQRGLGNIRFAAGEAREVVERRLPAGSVREVHCYHPQPYHDPREAPRRLITPRFLAWIVRALDAEGTFFVQTDNLPYWNYLEKIVPEFLDFEAQPGRWPDAPKGRTRREIIALRRGFPVYRGWGRKRPDIEFELAMRRAESLPGPLFDAGPPDRELEALDDARWRPVSNRSVRQVGNLPPHWPR
ncbi:MAG: methyltransferase domain-containing protein [Planctomycetes bacterium]|nr:methyltransferase domain-containing protein [Planctomycetota bacterium]